MGFYKNIYYQESLPKLQEERLSTSIGDIFLQDVPYRYPNRINQELFLLALAVSAHEAVNTTSSIYQLGLAGIERMGSARNFQLYQRVCLTFIFNGVIGFASGL